MAKSPIPVFKAERDAGLEQAIASNCSLAYISPVILVFEDGQQAIKQAIAIQQQSIELSLGKKTDFDLYPIYAILATTGWNKNDDIFAIQDTWAARYTPEDKPFNCGHVPSKIIGHITGSVVVDDKYEIIPDTTVVDDLPGKFHILTSAVVYKHINSRDKDLQEAAAELVDGIKRGEWFVSMECLFNDFDYGLTTASGEQQVIRRNEATAFLTKHLRIYEGTGEYNGCKVGRVLRNITFSGKGLVKNPANPESVIINDASQFAGVFASLANHKDEQINIGENSMADDVKLLQDQLAAANRKIEELGEQQVKATIAGKDTEITTLNSAIAAQNKKVEELTASYNAAVKAKDDAVAAQNAATATIETLTKERDALQTELSGMKAEAQKTNRISTLVDKGVDKAAAEAIVAKFANASDETFAEVVTMQAELVLAKKSKSDPADPDKGKGGKDRGAKTDENADPKGEAAAAGADLNGAKTDPDPAMGVGDGDKNAEVITALASYFDQTLTSGREIAAKK